LSAILLFAPDLRGPDEAEQLPGFERRAAAAASYLHATLGYDVLLVTPPSGLLPDAREYAAAIYRVADATGLRVLDLYSASRVKAAP
jgi:dihydrodipicolinate synthase/N-acetylneuraminate lyase